MEGPHAACVSCHRRSGMGSVEGNIDRTVLVPPVAGPVLFSASLFAYSELDKSHHYIPNDAWERAVTRTAYNKQNLALALRDGIDPDGKRLLAPMPRYPLDDTAMAALAAYLKQLSSIPAPGVEQNILHLATVVTPDVTPDQASAVVDVVRAWSNSARASGRPWRLHVWELRGAADTWLEQLLQYDQQQPVFALLSGAGGANWTATHTFCEQQRVACVLPSVEAIPARGDDWYSMYFSPGVSLEARILARHLDEIATVPNRGSKLIQLYSDASGRHAADVLQTATTSFADSISSRKMRMTAPRAALKNIAASDVLVLWLRPDEIAQLAAGLPDGPPAEQVFVSALLATPKAIALPAAWQQRVQFVSLFDDQGLQAEIASLRLERWLQQQGLPDDANRRLQADAYAACYLLNTALGRIKRQEVRRPAVPLRREHLLETLETVVNKYADSTEQIDTDSHIAYYGRMSLGPRQRLAVRGGTIMRYQSADSKRLVAVSPRIVP